MRIGRFAAQPNVFRKPNSLTAVALLFCYSLAASLFEQDRRTGMEIDRPDVKAEVEAALAEYERALVTNDVAVLDRLFLDRSTTIRYGGSENLYGYAEIAAFRAGRSPAGLARRLEQTMITTYGRDFAIASTLFRRDSLPGRVGRQMQTWVRAGRLAGRGCARQRHRRAAL